MRVVSIGTRLDVLRRGAGKFLAPAATGVFLVVVLSQLGGTGGLPQGTLAPTLDARLVDGRRFTLDGPPGEVIVLNFWASWCPPCRAEAPALSAVHARLRSAGDGRIVALNMDRDGAARAGDHAARLGLDVDVGVARDEHTKAFQVSKLPTTYVIAPDGRVVRSFVGEVTERALDAAIARAR